MEILISPIEGCSQLRINQLLNIYRSLTLSHLLSITSMLRISKQINCPKFVAAYLASSFSSFCFEVLIPHDLSHDETFLKVRVNSASCLRGLCATLKQKIILIFRFLNYLAGKIEGASLELASFEYGLFLSVPPTCGDTYIILHFLTNC